MGRVDPHDRVPGIPLSYGFIGRVAPGGTGAGAGLVMGRTIAQATSASILFSPRRAGRPGKD